MILLNSLLTYLDIRVVLTQGCPNPGRQVAPPEKFGTVAPNICGPAVCNLLHVTLLAPRILRWLLDFWKNLWIPELTGSRDLQVVNP